ncbi:SDR family NAD(P)-dependent oxidoreductase [Streptomyces sp. NPDC017940]|uniref:SDR family NAD(P)-dependent oxidoreductase n=1 Tax=Streptomyces sp. NPDC017940 TaxID=3365017 RepID=UPI00379C84DA
MTQRQQHGWNAGRIPDQTGRVCVVTGANSGLGLATTRALAHRGAHVILAVRDEAKGRAAVASLAAEQPRAGLDDSPDDPLDDRVADRLADRLEVRRLDLADLDSVRAFAAGLRADHPRLDVLVNNAGVMAPPRTLSPQGHELQFAANHLGHFALTGLLLGLLPDGSGSRVVTVTSVNHRQARLSFDDLTDDLTGGHTYRPMAFYHRSKLANAVFGHELHRRLTAAGSGIRSVLAHPGYTATRLQTSSPTGLPRLLFGTPLKPLAQQPERGALPQLYAATAAEATGGDLFGPDGVAELRGAPERVALAARATDPETARLLWELSEELTDVRYALPTGGREGTRGGLSPSGA